ncbi:MAG: hypothetical protein U1D30_02950 [Planctomycetota bacterium]
MDDLRFKELLRRADDGSPSSRTPDVDLASEARRILHHRRRRRSAVSAIGLFLLLTAGTAYLTRTGTKPVIDPAKTESIEALRREMARRDAEVKCHLAAAETRLEVRRFFQIEEDSMESRPKSIHPLERTAYLLVDFGDRLERELGLIGEATNSYGVAKNLYSESAWAIVARDRLNHPTLPSRNMP